jgi:tRNA uridine 5-carbamoylmethylation protein Kti12
MFAYKTAIILVGISGSGKSTIADKFIKAERFQGRIWKEINRDTIRKEFFSEFFFNEDGSWKKGIEWGSPEHKSIEDRVSVHVRADIIKYGRDPKVEGIIISDTNLNKKFRERLIQYVESEGFQVMIQVIDVPLDVALERNATRKARVEESVIRKQFQIFQSQREELS